MSNAAYATAQRSPLQPAKTGTHDSNDSRYAIDKTKDETKQSASLWSDKMALRIWIACGLALWLLGFINLITGVASR